MKIYLVGGAVRDELLGLPIKDRDWVVTGATPEDMLARGYRPVGQDFPVFLHPKTGEEYALARTERKSGHGYAGFTFHTSPHITLEDDLQRRDLTINAMAKDEHGQLIDPYGGQQDLVNRVLRHISPAFREDPLRILRVARFAARFAGLGFTVAEQTEALMAEMVKDGEAAWLVAERVWQETVQALATPSAAVYFRALAEAGALQIVMPELTEHFIDDDTLPAKALALACQQPETVVRFACAVCQPETGHAKTDNKISVTQLCQRLKTPARFREVAEQVSRHHPAWFATQPPSPQTRLDILQQADGFRRKDRFQNILMACDIICQASGHNSPLSQQLCSDLDKCTNIDIQALIRRGFKGRALALAIQEARLNVLR